MVRLAGGRAALSQGSEGVGTGRRSGRSSRVPPPRPERDARERIDLGRRGQGGIGGRRSEAEERDREQSEEADTARASAHAGVTSCMSSVFICILYLYLRCGWRCCAGRRQTRGLQPP